MDGFSTTLSELGFNSNRLIALFCFMFLRKIFAHYLESTYATMYKRQNEIIYKKAAFVTYPFSPHSRVGI